MLGLLGGSASSDRLASRAELPPKPSLKDWARTNGLICQLRNGNYGIELEDGTFSSANYSWCFRAPVVVTERALLRL